MASQVPSGPKIPIVLEEIVKLFTSRKVPVWTKLLPLIGLVAGLFIIPDWVPVCGQLDDATLFGLSMYIFWVLAKKYDEPPGPKQ